MISTLRAEQVKLTSLRGSWVAAALFVFLSLAFGLGNAYLVNDPAQRFTISNAGATEGILGFGMTVLMALGAVFITQEYRSGTIRLSFQATPARWRVMAAKGLLLAGVGAAGAILMAAAAIPLAGLVADPERHGDLGLGTAGVMIAALATTCAAAVLLALGIGALVRSTAVAVAVVVLWPTMLEATVARLPGVGEPLAPFLPFRNVAFAITGRTPPNVDYLWGQVGALAYFVGIAAVAYVAGVWAVERRDA
jgi:ABC-2 type transport system permease protein